MHSGAGAGRAGAAGAAGAASVAGAAAGTAAGAAGEAAFFACALLEVLPMAARGGADRGGRNKLEAKPLRI